MERRGRITPECSGTQGPRFNSRVTGMLRRLIPQVKVNGLQLAAARLSTVLRRPRRQRTAQADCEHLTRSSDVPIAPKNEAARHDKHKTGYTSEGQFL